MSEYKMQRFEPELLEVDAPTLKLNLNMKPTLSGDYVLYAQANERIDRLTAQVEELKVALGSNSKALKLAKVGLSYSGDCFAGEYAAKCKKMIETNNELLTRIGEDNE